jgi:hypothetical protein
MNKHNELSAETQSEYLLCETERHYLNVPYSQKNKAKKMGAMWDAQEKLWYVESSSPGESDLVKTFGNSVARNSGGGDTVYPTRFIFPNSKRKKPEPVHGFVYCAVCPSQNGLVKIGYTARCPQQRMKELSNTSVAFDFSVACFVEVSDCEAAEAYVHTGLSSNGHERVNPKREFFKTTPDEAHGWLMAAEGLYPVDEYLSIGAILTQVERDVLRDALATLRSLETKAIDPS